MRFYLVRVAIYNEKSQTWNIIVVGWKTKTKNSYIVETTENKLLNRKRKIREAKVVKLKKNKLFKETIEITDGKKQPQKSERLLH